MYTDYDTLKTMLRVAHSPSTFGWRRAAFADGLLAVAGVCGGLNRLAEQLDETLYAEHHQQPLGKPVYIVAAPRSGTTFLHRLMSCDPQFTTFKLYQTFFPTVTGHKLAERFSRANGLLGRTLTRVRQQLDQSFEGWNGIHNMGFAQDEEDEALWALALATPAIWLVLPFPHEFENLRFIDQLPEEKRAKLAAYYRQCVQRHLYANQGRTLLGKNVLMPGRFEIVTRALPEARFVHILRHPYEALPSTLSLFTTPWRWHSPELKLDGPESRALAELTIDYYNFLHRQSLLSESEAKPRFVTLTYRDLIADPLARIREIYERFELTMTPELLATLQRELEQQRHYKSEHQYSLAQFGLDKDYVYNAMRDVFEHYKFER